MIDLINKTKVGAILRYIFMYLISVSGKILAFILTPFIYPFKGYINNYVWNYMLSNKWYIYRSTFEYEDETNYYLKNGFITKRSTNKYLFYVLCFFYFFLDDDANLDCCSTMFSDPSKIKGLVIQGSYFDIGDLQRTNKINILDYYTFKEFYYWMVIRNGFYNFNYIIEESIMNKTNGILTYLSTKDIELEPSKRILKSESDSELNTEFSEHSFYSDSNNKIFFIMTFSKKIFNKYYGYEIGWRRKSGSRVNQVFRVYWGK